MAKSNFIVRGGADFSGIKKGLDQTRKQLADFQGKVDKSMKAIGTIFSGLVTGKLVKDSTSMAMGVESAIDNIARNMESASGGFDRFVKTQSRALGMAKSDAYKYGSTFSNLLASFSSGAEETAFSTQELMRAAAVIASKTGRSYEDVSERIRSGMLGSTEAIEDLGVYTNVSMIESTNAFKKFANGKTWAQLDFQVQQQIRLAAILEQTYDRYGNTLADTSQTRHAQFIASLKDIQLTLGQAFLPIYDSILPALTAMADGIRTAILYIQAFFQALFGGKSAMEETSAENLEKSTGNAAGNMGEAKEESEELKKSLAGFDDLNILSQDKKSSQQSGEKESATPGVPTGLDGAQIGLSDEYEDRMAKMNEGLESFKKKMQEIAPVLKTIAVLMAAMWAAFVLPAALVSLGTALGALGSKIPILEGLFAGLGNAIKAVGLVFSKIPGIILLGVIVAIAALVAIIMDLWKNSESFRSFVIQCWTSIKDALTAAANQIWTNGLKPLLDRLGITANSFGELYANYIRPAMENILTAVIGALTAITVQLIGIAAQIITIVLQIITAVIEALGKVTDWMKNNQGLVEGLTVTVAGFFAAWKVTQLLAFIQMSGGIPGVLNGMKTALITTSAALKANTTSMIANTTAKIKDKIATIQLTAMYAKDFLVSIAKGTAELIRQASIWVYFTALKVADTVAQTAMNIAVGAWNVIGAIAAGVTTAFGVAVAFLTSPIGLVILAVVALIAIVVLLVKHWDEVKATAAKVWDGISAIWGRASNWFSAKVLEPIKNAFKVVFGSILSIVAAPLNAIISMINTVIGALNKIKLPSWIPGVGGKGISIPTIPKLANGGITNGPMTALIGDNPGGREVVSPLDDLLGMIKESMAEAGAGDITLHSVIELDGGVVYKNQQRVSRQRGERLINGVMG